jgi:hypothetical protein
MNVQLCVVQRAYRELMARLEQELLQMEAEIRKSYETELQKAKFGAKVHIALFKPQHLSSDTLSRIRSYVGRLETKILSSSELTSKK